MHQERTPAQIRESREQATKACKANLAILAFLMADLSAIYISDALGASIYKLPIKSFSDEFIPAILKIAASVIPGICILLPTMQVYQSGRSSALKVNLAAALSTFSANLIATLIVQANQMKLNPSELQNNDAGIQFVAQSIGLMITFGVYSLVSSLCLSRRTTQLAPVRVNHHTAAAPVQAATVSGDYAELGDGINPPT